MEIKVCGLGCANCTKAKNIFKAAMAEAEIVAQN